MGNKYDNSAIEEFFRNNSNYAEAEKIASYLGSNESLLEDLIPFEETHKVWVSDHDKKRVLQKIIGSKSIPLFTISRMLIAAMVIGIVVSSIFLFIHTGKKSVPEEAIGVRVVGVKNNFRQPLKVPLPDGSVAILEQWAEIIYDSGFVHQREVFLTEGTAYFDVRKNPKRPFSVNAKGIRTTVLGTQFWVESPVSNASLTVRLKEGKVKLESTEAQFKMDDVYLEPGQFCYIDKDKNIVTVSNEQNTNKMAVNNLPSSNLITPKNPRDILWTNDGVRFKSAKLKSVLLQLETKYNVRIIIDEKLTDKIVLTGQIYFSDSLRPILKSICDMNNMEYRMSNDSVFMNKK